MAKELPYFKFEPSEWQNGNIQMCNEIVQLNFLNICCVYWSKCGVLTEKFALIKCCKNNKETIDELIELNVIKIQKNGNIKIDFLDKQLIEFNIKSEKQSQSGRKGGFKNGVRPENERKIGNQIYLLECWNDNERFLKLGITSGSISRRYSGKIQYEYKVLLQSFSNDFIFAEKNICEKLIDYEYNPKLNFAGQKECYKYSDKQLVIDIFVNFFNFADSNLLRNDAIREDKIIEDKIIEDKRNKKNTPTAEKFSFFKSLIDFGFQKNLVNDWLVVRKNKKASNTETALKNFITEIQKQECDINEVLSVMVTNSWSGFKFEWYNNLKNKNLQNGTTKSNNESDKPFAGRQTFETIRKNLEQK